MRTELGADVLEQFLFRAGIHPALCNLARAPVNDFIPLYFGVRLDRLVQAGNQLSGQECAILFWPSQHFSHFFSGNAHSVPISALRGLVASVQCALCCAVFVAVPVDGISRALLLQSHRPQLRARMPKCPAARTTLGGGWLARAISGLTRLTTSASVSGWAEGEACFSVVVILLLLL